MGVNGLWQLLQPAARPIALETLGNKRLAIDASIWLYQFQLAIRDQQGRALDNAHILGFLRRVCKLLFFGIRPVFVFDGGAPVLKKRTISNRKYKKHKGTEDAAKTAERILSAQLREAALKQAQKQKKKKDTGDRITQDTVYLADLENDDTSTTPQKRKNNDNEPSTSAAKKKKNKYVHRDQYELPQMEGPMQEKALPADPRLATEEELSAFIEEMRPEDFDINSSVFSNLPTEIKYEIIGDLRIKSRQANYKRVEAMKSAPTALDFSKAQIKNLMERNDLTQKLLTVTDALGQAHLSIPVRIASQRNKEYVLMKNEPEKGGGWVLGVRQEDIKQKQKQQEQERDIIKLDDDESDESASSSSSSDEDDDESEFEEVPVDKLAAQETPSPDREARKKMAMEAIRHKYAPTLPESDSPLIEDPSPSKTVPLFASSHRHRPRKSAPSQSPSKQDRLELSADITGRPPTTTSSSILSRYQIQHSNYSAAPVQNTVSDEPNSSESESGSDSFEMEQVPIEPIVPVSKGSPSPLKLTTEISTASGMQNEEEEEEAPIDLIENEKDNEVITPESLNEAKSPLPVDDDIQSTSNNAKQSQQQDTTSDITGQTSKSLVYEEHVQEQEDEQQQEQTQEKDANLDELENDIESDNNSPPASRSSSSVEWSPSPSPQLRARAKPTSTEDIVQEEEDEEAIKDALESVPLLPPGADEEQAQEYEHADVNTNLGLEQDQFATFFSQLQNRNLDEMQQEIQHELQVLEQQQKKDRRNADDVTLQMSKEIKVLLRFFGIPYVDAPMEAEAQCAELLSRSLVDGIITDDSDVFLFGGSRVYRNFFNQDKFVECYLLSDLDRELSLDREKLVRLAFFLGSDYVEGISGVGPVVGMELMSEFPGKSGLLEFKDWWKRVERGLDTEDDNKSAVRRRFKKTMKTLILDESWPSPAVIDAYYHPTVDESDLRFQWGIPDLDGLRSYLGEYLGWSVTKVDGVLLPVIKRMTDRGHGVANMQSSLDGFFDISGGTGHFAPRGKMGYASKRLQKVIEVWRASQRSTSQESIVNDDDNDEEKNSNNQSIAEELIGKSQSKNKPIVRRVDSPSKHTSQNTSRAVNTDENDNDEEQDHELNSSSSSGSEYNDNSSRSTKKGRKGKAPQTRRGPGRRKRGTRRTYIGK